MSGSKKEKELPSFNIPEFRPEEMPLSCTWIIIGPPATGKCLAKDTPVIMANGTVKKVQDIVTGDLLMGDDSTERTVLSTTSGEDEMYRIIPLDGCGDSFVVNEPHILSLSDENGTLVEMSVENYVHASTYYPEKVKNLFGYRTGVTYTQGRNIPCSPYYYGYLNGFHSNFHLGQVMPTPKKEGDEVLNYWKECGYVLSKDRRISNLFMTNSEEVRLEVLAGLIDADGFVTDDCYTIDRDSTTCTKHLVNDIVFLARSLGFFVRLIENYYNGHYSKWRIFIRGAVGTIPTRNTRIEKTEGNTAKKRLLFKFRVEYLKRDTYYGFQLNGNHRFLLGDFTVTHNTTFMENMAYYRKHVYPTARIFIGTEDGYKRFCKIFHPLYVSNYWDEKEEERHIMRQRTCEMENGRGYPGNYAINIIDDVSDDPKLYKTKLMRGIFKLGSQHWAQLAMIGTQYAIDMPPDVRKSVSYVAIGREPEEIERKKLYENFGGLAGSYAKFCDLMDQITGDHTFLIFKKRSQSNNIEECISWWQTKKLGDWKFGCKEYRSHGDARYDPQYKEQIVM